MMKHNTLKSFTVPAIRLALIFSVLVVSTCTTSSIPFRDEEPTYSEGDWPSYGLNHSNSLHNRVERDLTAENVGKLEIQWKIDGLGGVSGTPVVVDEVVYFGDWHGSIHAVEAASGEVIWETQLTEDRISASVLVTDKFVYVADLAGMLHARDRMTGAPVWSVLLDESPNAAIFSSPVLVEGMVILGVAEDVNYSNFRGSIVAVDAETGAERWRVFTTSADETSGFGVSVWSSAAIDRNRKMIFIGTGNTERPPDSPLANGVLAVLYETGEMAWIHRFLEEDSGRDLDVGASPNLFLIEGRDVVGAGGKSGEYRLLDRETGELLWAVTLTRGTRMGGVMTTGAVGDDVAYVNSNSPFEGSGSVTFALDARDGSILWEHAFPDYTFGALALANGVLYQGNAGLRGPAKVIALDATDGSSCGATKSMGLWEAESRSRSVCHLP